MIRKVFLALLAVIVAATIGGYGKERVQASGDQEATKQSGSSEGSPQRVAEDRVSYAASSSSLLRSSSCWSSALR